MSLRRPDLQHIADPNVFMQVAEHQAITLHADAEKVIGRRARQAVGAKMHSACKVEAHRQMLPGLKQRQPGAIVGLQVDRRLSCSLRVARSGRQRSS